MTNYNTSKSVNVQKMVIAALFAAVITVCAWLSIPIGDVPISLALLGIYLAGEILGSRYGFLSVLVYILLGAVGVPVFSSFRAGVSVLAGPTGGFIIGFLFTALVVGIGYRPSIRKSIPMLAVLHIAGCAVCYAFGSAWFMISMDANLATTLGACVIPFLPGDVVKIILSIVIFKALDKRGVLRNI